MTVRQNEEPIYYCVYASWGWVKLTYDQFALVMSVYKNRAVAVVYK